MQKNNIELLIDWYGETQKIFNNLDLIISVYDLSFTSFRILDQLYQSDELTPGDLSKIENTSKPAVSRKLNLLQAKGFLRKIRNDPSDQRVVKLEITADGENAYLAIKKVLHVKLAEIFTQIKATEYQTTEQTNYLKPKTRRS